MSFPAVHPALDAALLARAYHEPTPVQLAVLQPQALGRDLLVSARTGSGKTVAFGLAAAATLMPDGELPPPGAPLALVIAPTRELAMQVQAELAWLYASARIGACVGGTDIRREERVLQRGCHIVVGTPGRLGDHLRRENLNLAQLRVVVLDEADEMLDLGFKDELEFLLDAAPLDRRTLMFSATIPHDIAGLARKYQRNALRIDTVDRSAPHADIDYRAMVIAGHETEAALINTLRWHDAPGALVFCATRDTTRRLHGVLVQHGFAAVMLSGELSQHERTTALEALRAGRARVGVCTDVAARGLDLPALDLVAHADLPTNPETLLHRSGRTGRAGRKGVSVLLVPYSKRRRAEQVANAARIRLTWAEVPTAEDIQVRDDERLRADPILAPPEPGERDAVAALLAAHEPTAIAAALLRLNRRNLPQAATITPAAPPPRDTSNAANSRFRDAPAAGSGDFVQFRIAVGRDNRADPKWLVPLICRLGNVSKQDIGTIRIFPTDTRFELRREAAAGFNAAIADLPPNEPRIFPAGDGPMPPRPPSTRPFRPRPDGGAGAPKSGKPAYRKRRD